MVVDAHTATHLLGDRKVLLLLLLLHQLEFTVRGVENAFPSAESEMRTS